MSILTSIADKAKALIGNADKIINRSTGVYDCSKNRFFVAGLELDGVVTATLSKKVSTQAEQGLDSSYYTYYSVSEPRTLTIDVLPTAQCNEMLELLEARQALERGWFKITVHENGVVIDSFRSHIISTSDITLQADPNDRQYTFGVVSEGARNIADQYTQTPVAIEPTTDTNITELTTVG